MMLSEISRSGDAPSHGNGDILKGYDDTTSQDNLTMPRGTPPQLPPPLPPPPPDSMDSSHDNLATDLQDLRAPAQFEGTDFDSGGRKESNGSQLPPPKRQLCRKHTKSNTCNILSSLYGKITVVATAVLVLTEVMENNVPLLFFHGYIYAYLLGGSVVCLMGVYASMMVDKCPELTGASMEDIENGSPNKQRVMLKCSDVSIYLRIGVLVFGLGTLISCGLEIATIFTIPEPCTDPVNLAMPVLHAFFTFLQMHFLFMNSQRVAKSLGCARHMVLMHLVATNIAVWIKLLLWETSSEWLRQNHVLHSEQSIWPPKGLNFTTHAIDEKGNHRVYFTSDCLWRLQDNERSEDMLTLQLCLHNSTIGAIWQKAMPFLSPFIVQYSVLGAVIIYTLWDNFSFCTKGAREHRCPVANHRSETDSSGSSGSFRVIDCQGSSKGLFIGLLVLVAGIIVLILFFVLSNEEMEAETLSAVTTLHCAVQGLSALATVVGICRVRTLHHRRGRMSSLNSLLQGIGVLAVCAYGIFGIVVGASKALESSDHILLLLDGAFMVILATLQSLFIQEVASRGISRKQETRRPGLQIVTFLMFSNLVLWLLETFTNQNHISSQHQLAMFGAISWGIISRITLPLVIFYRFHSCVFLVEAWRQSNMSRKE
ncbi:proton channel OtopLc-like [Ornithodoros turicata]|uniref:proton channel OtopLc-like n=1 Tax=Ornithodoros turicata TaxID=34597 RepID=UPI00313A0046